MMTRTMALVIKKTPSMMGWKNRPNAGKRKLDSFGTTDVYLIGINIKDPKPKKNCQERRLEDGRNVRIMRKIKSKIRTLLCLSMAKKKKIHKYLSC